MTLGAAGGRGGTVGKRRRGGSGVGTLREGFEEGDGSDGGRGVLRGGEGQL